ncbi:MAG: hypothetical protein ACOCVN_03190 [bacterium]
MPVIGSMEARMLLGGTGCGYTGSMDSESTMEQMMENGEWNGGQVIGMGYVGSQVTVSGSMGSGCNESSSDSVSNFNSLIYGGLEEIANNLDGMQSGNNNTNQKQSETRNSNSMTDKELQNASSEALQSAAGTVLDDLSGTKCFGALSAGLSLKDAIDYSSQWSNGELSDEMYMFEMGWTAAELTPAGPVVPFYKYAAEKFAKTVAKIESQLNNPTYWFQKMQHGY